MNIPPSDAVQTLATADRHFFQVLVDDFRLAKRKGGSHTLTLRLHDGLMTIWNARGRRHVRTAVDADPSARRAASERLQREWNDETDSAESAAYPIPFRYANGGALPVVRLRDRDYYCLFYREIFPIGWNIANGSSDTRHELLRPFDIVDRELREELVIFNREANRRYVFQGDADKPYDWPEFAAARRLIERTSPELSFRSMNVAPLAYRWIDGPDRLLVDVEGQGQIRTEGCFLNVNAEDFGIEVDRVVRFLIEPGDILIDAETLEVSPLAEPSLVNAPIGLFDVDRMNGTLDGTHEFIPDAFFHDGVFHPCGEDITAQIDEVFFRQISRHLLPQQIEEYRSAPNKFDLCPVTRRIIGQYRAQLPPPIDERPREGGYEVFLSFAGEDLEYARRVHSWLNERRPGRVFFSEREIGPGLWSQAIDRAIESPSCNTMIVLASSREYLLKPAVLFEYVSFHQHIMGGRKAGASLIPLIHGFEARDLPMPLFSYQCQRFETGRLEAALESIFAATRRF